MIGRSLVLCAVVVATTLGVAAQSGRRKTPLPSPSPSTETQKSAENTDQPKSSPTNIAKPTFHPAAFIIGGKMITKGGKSYWSDDVGDVREEIKFMFEFLKLPAKIVKGGKMTRDEAAARAKQETDSYVVWMEINERIDVDTARLQTITTVERIDYLLLMPGTGEVVRQFTLDPQKIVQTNEHGTPLPPRTKGRTTDLDNQLRRCAWEMARVLEYWL
jgi:hypothetical protein